MLRLSVEVQNQDIIVRNPETGHSVTYRRMPDSPMLIALDPLRDDPRHKQGNIPRRSLEGRLHQSEDVGLALMLKRHARLLT